MTAAKPLPPVTVESAPYWSAAADGRLLLQRCRQCAAVIFYPRATCPSCMSVDLDWVEASGRGTIYSFTICYRAPNAAFRPDVPYIVALIDLEDGPRMMSNITDCDHMSAHIGMPVSVWFDAASEEIALPKFRPAGVPQ